VLLVVGKRPERFPGLVPECAQTICRSFLQLRLIPILDAICPGG